MHHLYVVSIIRMRTPSSICMVSNLFGDCTAIWRQISEPDIRNCNLVVEYNANPLFFPCHLHLTYKYYTKHLLLPTPQFPFLCRFSYDNCVKVFRLWCVSGWVKGGVVVYTYDGSLEKRFVSSYFMSCTAPLFLSFKWSMKNFCFPSFTGFPNLPEPLLSRLSYKLPTSL